MQSFLKHMRSSVSGGPPALTLLAGEQTAEAATLRALLDGNLQAAQKSIARAPDSLGRVLLQISLRDLEVAYGRKQKTQPVASKAAFGSAESAWGALIAARAEGSDPWSVNEPLVFKTMLDAAFPEQGLDVKSLVAVP
jgi:hypothetical protein